VRQRRGILKGRRLRPKVQLGKEVLAAVQVEKVRAVVKGAEKLRDVVVSHDRGPSRL
jgi:hypothetical protein